MDKRREWEALKHVFGSYAATAQESERPDFLITHPTLRHGVEVTELYPSLIDAKLQNLGDYTVGLLEGTQPLHRSDRQKLRIETVSLLSEDGAKVDDVRAIIQATPTHKEKVVALLEKLGEKCRKFVSYQTECDVVDLIVWDRGSLFGNEADFEVIHLAPAETRRQLISSPFREVFLLTRSPEPSQFFFYPIRVNVFLADALYCRSCFPRAWPRTFRTRAPDCHVRVFAPHGAPRCSVVSAGPAELAYTWLAVANGGLGGKSPRVDHVWASATSHRAKCPTRSRGP